MLAKLRNFNKIDKILLGLFSLLIIAVVIVGFNYKPKNSITQPQNTPQGTSKAQGNDDDTSNDPSQPPESSQSQNIASPANTQCHIRGELPDTTCTPGSIDPRVTQDSIKQTICVSGYTKTVRPSSSITSAMKKVSMQQYGFTDSPSNYEYDHLISLELGGAPQDTKNLWPEPGKIPNPKDKVENKLHSLVCSGAILLAEAQKRISTDWQTALSGY